MPQSRRFDRDEDVKLIRCVQKSFALILKHFKRVIKEKTSITLPRRKIGHDTILLEQIWKGRAPQFLQEIWEKEFRQSGDLTLSNIVDFLRQFYPRISKVWEDGQQAASRLMEKHRGLAIAVAQRVSEQIYHVDFDDLVGEATLAIISAALRFDPKHCTNFSTYAYHVIRSSLVDFVSRAQKGFSLSPSFYNELKKTNQEIPVCLFSDLENPEEDGTLSHTADEISSAESLELGNHTFDDLASVEYLDIIRKFPPPFNVIAYEIAVGNISCPQDMKELGFPLGISRQIFNVLAFLLSKHAREY